MSRKRWKKWRAERPRQAATLDSSWMPGDAGPSVRETLRARQLAICGLMFNDLPVSEARHPAYASEGDDATLGLFALEQLRVVVDGRNSVLYASSTAKPSARYDYNRLGAVFVAKEPDKGDDLAAHVAKGSPAYRAGIRDGDLLLKIGELDATRWRVDPSVGQLPFLRQAAGTRLMMTLKRNGRVYKAAVTLEELPSG